MSDLLQRLKDRAAVIDGYAVDPANLPKRMADERALLTECIAALSVAPAPVDAQYPTAVELVQIGHKAKEAHPNDPEQMFYASMRMACDWSRARFAAGMSPYKYYFRFQDGEEEYIDADNEERLAEIVEHNAHERTINQIVITPLYTSPPAQSIPAAPCQCKPDETTGWTDDDIMVPRCNICGLVVMRVIAERKAERVTAAIDEEGRKALDLGIRCMRAIHTWGCQDYQKAELGSAIAALERLLSGN